jgi:hypothetical protein
MLQGAVVANANMFSEAAQDKETTNSMDPFKWAGKDLPMFTVVLKVSHIPGRDTSKAKKYALTH